MSSSSSNTVDPEKFISAVQPALESQDLKGLLALLKRKWTREQIIELLRGPHHDARKVAALCLSLVGCKECIQEIAQVLKDPDPCVNQMAEHALWSIWFRGGSEEANHQLGRGAQALGRRDFPHAIRHFDRAIELCPEFPEPYNQRAIAHFLLEEYDESLADCHRAIELMPCHFGAWCGMGHSYAHIGELSHAIEAYERALAINPHMNAIREAIAELRTRAGER
jgi:tetratricopeptide (TPR) repeat protein